MVTPKELTNRQIKLLYLIIQLYLKGTQEISSLYIKSLGICKVSSATIRNELNVLTEKGYLTKAHFASGRKPTLKSFILFIQYIYASATNQLATQPSLSDNYTILQNDLDFLKEHIKKVSSLYSIFTFITYNNDVKYFGISTLINIATRLYSQKTKTSYQKFHKLSTLFDEPKILRKFLIRNQNNLFYDNFSIQFIHLAQNNIPHIVLGFISYKIKHPEFIGFITPLNLNIFKILQSMIYINQILNYQNL